MAMLRVAFAALLLALLPVQGTVLAAQDDPRLNDLFAALAKAPSAEMAAPIEAEIGSIWTQSKSATTELLLARGAAMLESGDVDVAYKLMQTVTALDPDFAEGWNMLANVQLMREQTSAAIAAVKRTLELEPRHYPALAALGNILESLGDDKAALAAYDASLKINPTQEDVKQQAKTLRRKIEGDRI